MTVLHQTPAASTALARMVTGSLTAAAYLDICLAAVDRDEAEVNAFASLDRERALRRAHELDGGAPHGLLHGIPIGVKDVIATRHLPTEYNSPMYRGHRAGRNAAVVAALEAEGAIVLGKTSTVEFASLGRVPDTRNPWHRDHTPGGTSSGSAVAVATGMVPVALGTQTGGSTIRPASFCGVAALKPTWGLVPVDGLRPYAPSLDTITWMSQCVADLARVLECFRPLEPEATIDRALRIGFYRTPYWDRAETATRSALDATRRLLERSGAHVEDVDGPAAADGLNAAQDTIMHGEGRLSFLAEYLAARDSLHPDIVAEAENRRNITPDALARAYDYLADMRVKMERCLSGFDAWLVPAVPGEAPAGLAGTGDAVFNRLWTGLHVPAVTLPGFRGDAGLPVGIQLVAPRFRDRHLLAVARAVEALVSAG